MKNELTSRQLQAKETKQKILDVANALIMEKEYEEITMAEIALAAGVSIGGLYHYFNSKEELFFPAMRLLITDWRPISMEKNILPPWMPSEI